MTVRSRRPLEIAVLFLIASISFGARSFAQNGKSSPAASNTKASSAQKADDAAGGLSAIVASGRLDDLRWPDFSDYRMHVTNFYRPSGYKLAWIRDGAPSAQALELIEIFKDADREGLQAEDYDASRWGDRVSLLKGAHGADDEARFDAAVTVCAMRYVSDVHIGRINPQNLGFEFDVSHKKLDLPQFVRQRLAGGSDLRSELVAIEPPFLSYQRLRAALLHYMELEKKGDGEKVLDVGGVPIGGRSMRGLQG